MVLGEHCPRFMFLYVTMLTPSSRAICASYISCLLFARSLMRLSRSAGTIALLLCISGVVFLPFALIGLVAISITVLVTFLLTRPKSRKPFSNNQIFFRKNLLNNARKR